MALGDRTVVGMNDSKRGAAASWAWLGLIVVAWGGAPALAGSPTKGAPGAVPGAAGNVEMVVFADPRRAPVRLLRGASHPAPPAGAPARAEILTFKPGGPEVRLIRGVA